MMSSEEVIEKFVFNHTRKHVTIEVYGGDVAQEEVDALVVACSLSLTHVGLAAALMQMAGSEASTLCQLHVKQNGKLDVLGCLITKAGNLPAKHLIHVAPPSFTSCGGCDDLGRIALETMFENAIVASKHHNARSLTFTAVARGLGFKGDVWAIAAVDALTKCMNNAKGLGCLQSIRFVDANGAVVRTLLDTFKKSLGLTMKREPAPSWAMPFNEEEDSDASSMGSAADEAALLDAFESSDEAPSTSGSTEAVKEEEEDDQCPICICDFDEENPKIKLDKCQHAFHKHCIDVALFRVLFAYLQFFNRMILQQAFINMQPQCPICKMWYGLPMGNMPEGSQMTVTVLEGTVQGFDCARYHQIHYSIPGGIQGPKHLRPGRNFSGTQRTAYIPDTAHGRQMVALLKLAFDRRLTFTVGDSVTSGSQNVVTWNNIHHKTSLTGGSSGFGYPDEKYLNRLEEELASVGITKDMIK